MIDIPGRISEYFYNKQERKFKKQYSGWCDEKWVEHCELIWGDDLSGLNCNRYTMNDIEIMYNHKTKLYSLSIETAFMFDSYEKECEYLKKLLDRFAYFMKQQKLDTDYINSLFMSVYKINNKTKTLEELYYNFKMFVNGRFSLIESKNPTLESIKTSMEEIKNNKKFKSLKECKKEWSEIIKEDE